MTIRRDLHLHNEATGWVLTSGTRNGHPPREFTSEGGAKWKAAIEDGSIVPLGLYQDDALELRVVAGERLTADEEAEWVDRLSWKLAIPDGKLVITAGTEWLRGEDPQGEFVREVEVPAGTYRVDVYTFMHGVNGVPCLAKARVKETVLRKWFTSTRPGMMPPAWLAERLGEAPLSPKDQARRDAERQAQEENAAAQEKSWRVWNLDPAPLADEGTKDERVPLDFLVHLTPWREELPLPASKRGWFSHIHAPRQPERCPLGIYSERPPEPSASAPGAPVHASVSTRVEHRALHGIPGGPVTLDVATELALPFWLSLLCKPDLVTEIRVGLRGADFAPQWPPAGSGISATRSEQGWTIAIAGWGPRVVRLLHRLGTLLASLPDGATIEMNVAPDPDESVRDTAAAEAARLDAGMHRYRGEVRGGAWHITESAHQVVAEALRGALAIAREVDSGGPVTAHTAAEADAMWAHLEAHGVDYKMGKLFGNPGVRREGLALHGRTLRDAIEPGIVAFRERFRGVWPLDRPWTA